MSGTSATAAVPKATTTNEDHVSDDEKDEEQPTNVLQKKEDAKVEKELDRVTDRVDEEDIGPENIGNVNQHFSFRSHEIFFVSGVDHDQR